MDAHQLVERLRKKQHLTSNKGLNSKKPTLRSLYPKDADFSKNNLPVKDDFNNYRIKFKEINNVPFKLGLVGMSDQSGKSNALIGVLSRPVDKDDPMEGYAKVFKPENIYLIGPSYNTDDKWVKYINAMGIPGSNIITEFVDEDVIALLSDIKKKQNERKKKQHYLIVFDDVSHDGSFKKKQHGAMSALVCNERHNLISVIFTTQSYVDFTKTMRRNVTGLYVFGGFGPDDIKSVYGDLGSGLKAGELEHVYNTATKQPYCYLEIIRENYKPKFRDKDHQVIDNTYDRFRGFC